MYRAPVGLIPWDATSLCLAIALKILNKVDCFAIKIAGRVTKGSGRVFSKLTPVCWRNGKKDVKTIEKPKNGTKQKIADKHNGKFEAKCTGSNCLKIEQLKLSYGRGIGSYLSCPEGKVFNASN